MSLAITQIEYWALEIIDVVEAKSRVEDSRVELKADWIKPEPAARRLAGHANAARGENLLWLFGIDEDRGVVGVEQSEPADWWPQVNSQFQGPILTATPVNIHHEKGLVVAMLIETGAGPYVVKNPRYGTPGGGSVELEVPWREMTSVRTARHEDLIRLLVPRINLPQVEVIDGGLIGGSSTVTGEFVPCEEGPPKKWHSSFVVYAVPPQGTRDIVFPAHCIEVSLRWRDNPKVQELQYLSAVPSGGGRVLRRDIDLSTQGPGRLEFEASAVNQSEAMPGEDPEIEIRLRPAGHSESLLVRCAMKEKTRCVWEFESASLSVQPWSQLP